VQAMARGHVTSLAHLRQIVRNSWDVVTYEPRQNNEAYWDNAYSKFRRLI
jgi:hypothetical protein